SSSGSHRGRPGPTSGAGRVRCRPSKGLPAGARGRRYGPRESSFPSYTKRSQLVSIYHTRTAPCAGSGVTWVAQPAGPVICPRPCRMLSNCTADGRRRAQRRPVVTSWQSIDFFSDESLVDDPYPYFEALRSTCPVLALPHHGVVAVTGYDEATEVYRDID